MKEIRKKILIIIFLLTTSNCGYKTINNSELESINFSNIILTGDKRVNFKIRNNLLSNTSKDSNNDIFIKVETKKLKEIKEKNIKNQITKYELSLTANAEITLTKKNKSIVEKFRLETNGDYIVNNKYSTTLKNEKKLLETLTNDLSDQIIKKITLFLNDI